VSLSVKNDIVTGNGRRNHCDTSLLPWLIFSEAVIHIGLTKVGTEILHLRVYIICTCFATAKPK